MWKRKQNNEPKKGETRHVWSTPSSSLLVREQQQKLHVTYSFSIMHSELTFPDFRNERVTQFLRGSRKNKLLFSNLVEVLSISLRRFPLVNSYLKRSRGQSTFY